MTNYIAQDQLLKGFYFPMKAEMVHDHTVLITQSLIILRIAVSIMWWQSLR